MIPTNITKKHVLEAVREIDAKGVPVGRDSRKFKLACKGKLYPPKYVVSLANRYANGKDLDSLGFGGGIETNAFLESLGFRVIGVPSANKNSECVVVKAEAGKHHDERCPECKQVISKMLRKLYGRIETNYKVEIGALPDAFSDSRYYQELKDIFLRLKSFRGHKDFVRVASMPRVDFFVPNPGFVVEFDEAQHFTACREESLLGYPKGLKLGYEARRWISLCGKISSRDNDPPFRDEQRAWYDTLRDFLPSIKKLGPTVRLFSLDFQWCKLDPQEPSDVRMFRQLLEGEKSKPDIEVKADPNASLARIIIAGGWDGNVNTAKELLYEICDKWPGGKKADCLVTCGAFLNFPWPGSLTDVGDNKFPENKILGVLISEAKKWCDLLLDEAMRRKLAAHADYLTIGIDSHKDEISLSGVSITHPHAELVVMVDLRTHEYFWTGKSYPTSGQEYGLVRFQDVETHFVKTSFGKVMILGCHDLNVFSKRGQKTTKEKWRRKAREDFYSAVNSEKPDVVLHHPHTTDSSRIWTAAWNELVNAAPSIKRYIGAGLYFREEGERSRVEDVLAKTKRGATIDFVCRKVYKKE